MERIYSTNGYEQMVEGVKIKTLKKDDSMLMSEFVLKKGSKLPEHSHPNVKSGYMLKGKIRLYINGKMRELVPGSSWCIQNGLVHWAEVEEDSVIIEVYSPVESNHPCYVYDMEVNG